MDVRDYVFLLSGPTVITISRLLCAYTHLAITRNFLRYHVTIKKGCSGFVENALMIFGVFIFSSSCLAALEQRCPESKNFNPSPNLKR